MITGDAAPLPFELRSPRKARERIDWAAVALAGRPEMWPQVVGGVRKVLGRPPLTGEEAVQFIRSDISGRAAAYPVFALEKLAGGGMNMVARTRDCFVNRLIVVRKHLPAESAMAEANRKRRDELLRSRLLKLPRHPVIPRFWATGTLDGERCEVFDFAPGTSLMRYVSENGLTFGAFLDFAYHAARGLHFLHRHGLIHADVKPENFCVEETTYGGDSKSVRVTLIDFDIISTPEEQIEQYTLGNGLEGTLPYMPPENFQQYVPDNVSDARQMVMTKDVFALGLTLARVATGGFPKNFLTTMTSLLDKKVSGDAVALEFTDALPFALQVLIRSMCESYWQTRPSLPAVMRTVRDLRASLSHEESEALIARPEDLRVPSVMLAEPPVIENVGPYRIVNRNFAPRPANDGQVLPIAELQDPLGRRLVGIPFAFATREEERAFYENRAELLRDLNEVRLTHPELFPGSFRDLVREEPGGTNAKYIVWILRPLLEGAKDIHAFLAEERPNAPVIDRIAILRRTAEALNVLEKAGYRLPRLTPQLIFFVPQPADPAHLTASQAMLTRPIKRLFDVPAAEPGKRFRQEVMGTASAIPAKAGAADPTAVDFMQIAHDIGVFRDLGEAERSFLQQAAQVATWEERVSILVWVEMQSGGTGGGPVVW
ncbi:MAG: protein kinase [Acidobacteria bacterium]|nr:protein kinase [Acidobacteriota bacterium]